MTLNQDLILSLRQLREAKQIQQKDIAKMLDISQAHYSRIEQGTKTPTIDMLHMLAVFYGTSMDYIYNAYKHQVIIWHYPDAALEYGMRAAVEQDINYIKSHYPAPDAMPEGVANQ